MTLLITPVCNNNDFFIIRFIFLLSTTKARLSNWMHKVSIELQILFIYIFWINMLFIYYNKIAHILFYVYS